MKKELDYEQNVAKESGSASALDKPPEGWELEVKPESTTMRLKKSMGNEDIVVEISTLDQEQMHQDEAEEDEENEAGSERQYAINFQVDCSKGGEKLRFAMVFMEDDTSGPVLEHVGLVPPGTSDEDLATLYTGPAYDELDEAAQAEFQTYLTERGIDASLGQYLCQLTYDKEQKDYEAWLSRVCDYLKK